MPVSIIDAHTQEVGMSVEDVLSPQLPTTTLDIVAPFMQKPASLMDAAFNLFGYLPPDDDLRWSFLKKYSEIKDDFNFKAMNFDNAWGATYLSEEHSWRSGYVTTINPENIMQLDRALDNLAYRKEILRRHEQTDDDDVDVDVDVRLRLTDALISHPGKEQPPETPCPEALYQLRLYVGEYLGRIGFNIHFEAGIPVVSIVNVQGIPNGRDKNAIFQEQLGVNPFNLLVKRVKRIATAGDDSLEVRGIVNPKKGNSRLYYGVFQAEDIPMYKAFHKPSYSTPQE